jgi:hypothetical protein
MARRPYECEIGSGQTYHHARVISDRKWPVKKRSVIAHIQARSIYSFFIINGNDYKKIAN